MSYQIYISLPPIHTFYNMDLTNRFGRQLHIVTIHLGQISFIVFRATKGNILERIICKVLVNLGLESLLLTPSTYQVAEITSITRILHSFIYPFDDNILVFRGKTLTNFLDESQRLRIGRRFNEEKSLEGRNKKDTLHPPTVLITMV